MRDLLLGGAELPQRRRRNKADQKPKDGEDNEKLEQREAALLLMKIAGGFGTSGWSALRIAHADKPEN